MMRKVLIALALLLGIAPASAQNYNATAGSGLVFGSKFVGSVNYPQIVFCDPATPAQCVGVNASGQMTIANTTFAATQSGTWTVQPGNVANTTPWKVDGSAVTQPVSASSLPLPTGAATAANQATEITSLGTIATNSGTQATAANQSTA